MLDESLAHVLIPSLRIKPVVSHDRRAAVIHGIAVLSG
jgi:hypothetical protein